MKAYVCDACGITMPDPYKAKMKEFFYAAEYACGTVLPGAVKRRVKIHLCDECFKGLHLLTPRRGKWLTERIPEGVVEPYCSKCGEEPYCRSNLDMPNYCPNCGADMQEGAQ